MLSVKKVAKLRAQILVSDGQVIGGVAWNLLLLLYKHGYVKASSVDSRVDASETKRLIRQMTTTKTRS